MTYFTDELPRLRIGSGWTEVSIESEVGVVKTARGYAPALHVRRGDVAHLLLIGAASLAGPLEKIRAERAGLLLGACVRIRRVRPDQTAPYEVESL